MQHAAWLVVTRESTMAHRCTCVTQRVTARSLSPCHLVENYTLSLLQRAHGMGGEGASWSWFYMSRVYSLTLPSGGGPHKMQMTVNRIRAMDYY